MTNLAFEKQTKALIDDLKSVCTSYGLGNDGNVYKVIIQVFLYKFINDKFAHEVKKLDKRLAAAKNWEDAIKKFDQDEYELLSMQLNENTAKLKPSQFISSLYAKQNDKNYAKVFDSILLEIAKDNSDIFSIKTDGGEKVVLFEDISKYVTDRKDEFCRAIINKLTNFSFEQIFHEKFDFFSTIFEYLIKDYNTNSGGIYAEYFTPHAVAKIMAACLVDGPVRNVSCYDPSAGSGTLLMNLAHQIGEQKCSIYSQDISQKSSNLLRLNLILNNLVHSIPNIIKGNTIKEPYHKDSNGKLKKFDFIVSNPPFKLDFSEWVKDLDTKENKDRFFAGLPKIPTKDKKKMAIYPLFIQHILFSLATKGRAAVVVPAGFLTAPSSIERKIRQKLIDKEILRGAISMPSNIFATTGTNVSIIFIDNSKKYSDVILMDASKLGTVVKEGENQKTVLSKDEENLIIDTFNQHKNVENFATVLSFDQIKEKNYSFSAGQYFDVKEQYSEISPKEFNEKLKNLNEELDELFSGSRKIEKQIQGLFGNLKYDL